MSGRIVLVLLILLAGAPVADEGPLVFRREPDRKTEREIEDLISARGKSLAAARQEDRRAARDRLVEIGGWATPFLGRAIVGRKAKGDHRVRLNAVTTIYMLRDRLGYEFVRAAARADEAPVVREAALLVIGRVGHPAADAAMLREALAEPDRRRSYPRAAALAAAKLQLSEPLLAAFEREHDPNRLAALLLAAAVASPDAPLLAHLDHKDDLVRLAAATALRLRPPAGGLDRVQDAFRTERDAGVRVALVHVLGALGARDALLDIVRKTSYDRDVRAAAAVPLAHLARPEDFKLLERAYQVDNGRDVAVALQPALLRCGGVDGRDRVLKGLNENDRLRIASAGSLLHFLGGEASSDDVHEITRKVRALEGDKFLALRGIADRIRSHSGDAAKRAEIVRKDFASLRDPCGLGLWRPSPEDRTWDAVNAFLWRVFELSNVTEFGDPDAHKPESAVSGGESGAPDRGKSAQADPDDQDLSDLLGERYFGPGDLVAR